VRPLFWIGLVVLVLGIASFFVPLPRHERHGIEAGDVNIGVDVKHEEHVSPIISGVLIAGGIGMMAAGARGRAAA
jgi:hypothetical protein